MAFENDLGVGGYAKAERMVRDAAAAYCQDKLAPRALTDLAPQRVTVGTTAADCIRYTSGSPDDPNTGIYACLEKIWTRANFMKDLEGDPGHVATQLAKMIFVTGLFGADKWRASCFARGEAYTRTDQLGRYMFHGIPMRAAAIIDSLNLDFATSYASPYGSTNPAFWLINANHLWIKFKQGHQWVESDPISAGPELYNVKAVWRHAFWQCFIPDDRRRHGTLVAA